MFVDNMRLIKKTTLLIVILIGLSLQGCGGAKAHHPPVKLHYLDDYIISEDLVVDQTKVGGLSDLDYDGRYFYTICDLPSAPRIYKMAIDIKNQKIDSIRFLKTIKIPHRNAKTRTMRFDSEGLLYRKNDQHFIISSEGSISKQKDPFIAELDEKGALVERYHIPDYFKAKFHKGPRNNGVFEGLDRSIDEKGIWVVNELPLKMDGRVVKLYKTFSPVRFTYYDQKDRQPKKQFIYKLGRLRKVPFLPFGLNGVSAIIAYKPDQFLVLERAFSAGHGRHGYRARLYWADARKATNTLHIKNMRKNKQRDSVRPAMKRLIFDFNSIRKQLTVKVIDNLEGMALGPKLANGHQSLILISDNNFSSFAKQMNQVILMEIIPKD